MKMKKMIKRLLPMVSFPDYNRTSAVSTLFGYDRGTPIDRFYIEDFLAKHATHIKGRVLEVGEDQYMSRFGRDVAERVVLASPGARLQGSIIEADLTDLDTLPEQTFDCFICTQTLNFIFDVKSAIAGSCYLLKPGGVMLATVAGISQISRYDMERWGDYWRFTTLSIQKLFEQVFGPEVIVTSYGNVLAACAFLQGLAVEDLPDVELLSAKDQDYQLVITVVARKKE